MIDLKTLRGQFSERVSLADYTAWRVGGPADILYIPADSQDLVHFLQQLPKNIPLLYLGLGSNVLIRDGGVEGVVIVTQGALNQTNVLEPTLLRAEAGVSCAQFARYTARLGLTGVEFLAGIPGTIGGALAMNAGCYGGETWQFIKAVEVVTRSGQLLLHPASDYEVGYRHVQRNPENCFMAGHFQLQSGEKNHSLSTIRVLLEKRNASQPTNLPNCGSVFRNPNNDYAARLIQQCGLKGKTIGGCSVSEKHANFIINNGHATAADIENLMTEIAAIVKEKTGVELIQEVCIIGKPL